MNLGHFTQIVWKDTKELGIGRFEPKPGTVIVVVNCAPAGNVIGEYENNVFLEGGKKVK